MHTLLLADDSVTVQRVLASSFVGQPFEVVIAKDGQDAIDRMAAVRPDIVLADTNMPCVDGYGVSAWVRQQPHLKGVPVLLLASALDPVDEQRFQMSGATAVLEKPFEPIHVIDRVKELLGMKPAAADASGSRLVTAAPIKVIRPPDKPERAPAPASVSGADGPLPTPVSLEEAPTPASMLRSALASLETSTGDLAAPVSAPGSAPDDAPLTTPVDALTDLEPPDGWQTGLAAVDAVWSVGEAPGLMNAPDVTGSQTADVFQSLLDAEQGAAGGASAPIEVPMADDDRVDDAGSANLHGDAAEPGAVTRAMLDEMEARLRLSDIRGELQQSIAIAVNEAVVASVRDAVAAQVSAVLAELRPAMEEAVRESVASVVPAAVAQATAGVREDVQGQVTAAVAAAMPAAVADAAAGPLGESVRAIVLDTSERLVKEEIARVRGR